ncbi:MAG: 16S rRNA (cytosine(1402)-N(4))-methyltransferase RsmH [Tenuifilum sp.]|uniref:16S rRNA (cytosine(1402)-N(4))-methyltransferase RsmH n=1 Tax=Tenuifilum sp. TaxID=2760880 RepID=UPI001B7421C7|nr:16S rRNA (cytosine(1402)-N(4))-methyltransferase RsmH [Bacteroidales bacterium]HON71233.1 16S rRNA (cytosine(1402)-N(4))-methyltransferase RsmH [Tenuifilum sp.]MBP9029281.1 16S rRNA (cytosine(1402)-N(4))-methyltransferase RsmH [Bacteroidales bacterium]HOU75440.1 16S rRNA (cytosine(1402)-N(4))-methyltransferase RsmH [Tenuifilum sp.]HQE54728.1 16S rRNA (cytosine(1402)-N(4))-methyltransferase RsmH [Tenuifilum sp.]
MAYHVPVLLTESIEGLNISPNGVYVDLTFGGGGHSRAILEKLGRKGRLIAFDQDEEALKNAIDDSRFMLIRSNFRYFRNFLRYHGIDRVNGILADLGVSSHHLDSPDRGFSFRFEGALDMRMNRNARLTAQKVVNDYPVEELARILKLYGEVQGAGKMASVIAKARESQKIETADQLLAILKPLVPFKIQNKVLAQVFQAIRIEVNREMESLKAMLENSSKCLLPGGRLVVISYHSLEDRMVKNYLRYGNVEGTDSKDLMGNRPTPFEQVNKKVITPTEEECLANNRARSAKLRIGERL